MRQIKRAFELWMLITFRGVNLFCRENSVLLSENFVVRWFYSSTGRAIPRVSLFGDRAFNFLRQNGGSFTVFEFVCTARSNIKVNQRTKKGSRCFDSFICGVVNSWAVGIVGVWKIESFASTVRVLHARVCGLLVLFKDGRKVCVPAA